MKLGRITTSSIAAILLWSVVGCSTVPDWSVRESREVDVTIHYPADGVARTVSIPSSTTDVLILQMESSPSAVRETFTGAQRELVLPGGRQTPTVRCRYRLFRTHAADGTPLPWTRASALFPGASRIVNSPADATNHNRPQGQP